MFAFYFYANTRKSGCPKNWDFIGLTLSYSF